ncbi:hypothetical protein Q8A73_016345 [Channa argus]|nr:hypothetical protein Q8A73_016345 [Channa argus]
MSESGGSLCQVKQLPCHSIPLCRMQASGHHMYNLTSITHQPWVNHPALSVSTSPSEAVRHRVTGATAGGCSNLECVASRLGEGAAWGVSSRKVVVTGGGGYFGFRLGKELASQGMSVILLDLNKPPCEIPDGAIFYKSDIRDYSSLYKVCEGVDCIFHTASYGMSGPEQLRKEQVESVNVGGTNNVINVCKERSIPRLVYTSTINVVFTGKPIEDGDEASVSSVPPEMVNVERRLFSFRFGDPQARMNWVHVDNLVLAHTLAAEALTLERNCIASGQPYFINDGVSVNLFEWLTPLVRNIAVNHTFKIDKARRELGYCPKTYSLVDSVELYLKSQQPRSNSPLLNFSWTCNLSQHLVLLLLLSLQLASSRCSVASSNCVLLPVATVFSCQYNLPILSNPPTENYYADDE